MRAWSNTYIGTQKYVLAALEILAHKQQMWDEDVRNELWIKTYTDECKNLFKTDGVKLFMWYFLDNKGLTEHGGSVGGCWLTEEGKELLKELRLLYSFQNAEEVEPLQIEAPKPPAQHSHNKPYGS